MKKSAVKAILMLCVCALVAGVFAGCGGTGEPGSNVESKQPEKIEWMKAIYDIDVLKPAEMVGFADYVFVGYVERYIETEYDPSIPYPITHYTVRVLDNIKGKLRKEPIEYYKQGGVTEDGTAITLFEYDQLPEIGKLYVFLAVARRNHTVIDCAPVSNIPLEEELQEYGTAITAEQLAGSSVVRTYQDAYTNEVPYEDERFHSIYEEGYTAPEDGSESSDGTSSDGTTASEDSSESGDESSDDVTTASDDASTPVDGNNAA